MSTEPNGLPSSEDLDRIVEEEHIKELTETEPTVTNVNSNEAIPSLCTCGAPRRPSDKFCLHCGQDFTNSFSTQREPLTDEDGTVHQGRRIRLIGEGWPNDLRLVKDMSDEELETQILGLQKLLQNAIRTTDYAQISIAAREYELGYRKHSRYVSAVKRREKLEQGVLRINAKKYVVGKSQVVSTQSIDEILAKQLGLSLEEAKKLRLSLAASKAKP